MSKNIATAYVRFVQVSGGKRRPIFILQETEDKVFFFDITTKFKNKSEEIQNLTKDWATEDLDSPEKLQEWMSKDE